MHKGRIHGLAKGGSELSFGSYGLKALTPDRITARQIEAARRAITREMKRAGRLWIRIFPDVPVSDKPAEVRMGKGVLLRQSHTFTKAGASPVSEFVAPESQGVRTGTMRIAPHVASVRNYK